MKKRSILNNTLIGLIFISLVAGCNGGGGGGETIVTPTISNNDSGELASFYKDADGDGFGDSAEKMEAVTAPVGYVDNDYDCNDNDPLINPDASEICGDGIDNNCDGVSTACSQRWYADSDGDGYGDPNTSLYETTQPAGYVDDYTDCNDSDAGINPGATEIPYDGIDQDCNGWDLTDVDGDGYNAVAAGGFDCNDNDSDINPEGYDIIGNGIDENCDGHDMTIILNSALRENLTHFDLNVNLGYTWPATKRGHAMFYLAVMALDGYADAETRLFEHIASLLLPGNEPDTTGSLNERGHVAVMAALALIKSDPILWNKLTSEQQEKIALIAEAELAACATTTSDAYTFETGLDGQGNFKKTWNPNYREASLGTLIAAALFFGPSTAMNILDTFDAEAFIAQAAAAGLPTIARLFEYDPSLNDITLTEIENAVRDYTYLGRPLSDLVGIYESAGLSQFTFDKNVCCYVSDGSASAGLISGCSDLPNFGAKGMCHEFNSIDGEGLRSSLSYSALGWSHNTVSEFLLRHFGYEISTFIINLKAIGTTDLFYKAEHGYASWSMGAQKIEYESNLTFGFKYVRALWEDYLNE